MKFKIPSSEKMIWIFILIGPLFWLIPYLLIAPYGLKTGYSFTTTFSDIPKFKSIPGSIFIMLEGGMVWWILACIPSFWLITWIPTTLAAVIYRYILNITYSEFKAFESRILFTLYNAILSAIVSAGIFSVASFISFKFIKMDSSNFINLWTSQIAVVGIVGFCLGLLVGCIPKFTPRDPEIATQSNAI